MLVDHADVPGDGIRGRGPNALFSANENLPGVRPQHAVKDLHGGGFAYAVFTDDAMNRARFDAQVYPRVGQHAAELLRQSAQFNCWKAGGRHFSGSVRVCPRESTLGGPASLSDGTVSLSLARDSAGSGSGSLGSPY